MKRTLKYFLASILVLNIFGTPSHASSTEDEQWVTPDRYDEGFQGIVISDVVDFTNLFSRLEVVTDNPAPNTSRLCNSITEQKCRNFKSFFYHAVLPKCANGSDTDCVVGLSAKFPGGKELEARYINSVYENHINRFKGNQELLIPDSGLPSIWNIPGAPHKGGTLYAVMASIEGGGQPKKPAPFNNFGAYVVPVERVSTGAGDNASVQDGFPYFYPLCIEKNLNPGEKPTVGCRGMQDSGLGPDKIKCVVMIDEGSDCYTQRPFPENISIKLDLRFSSSLNGWLHGRMKTPEISISTDSKGRENVSISASPIKVPIFYHGDKYVNLPAKLQEAYATRTTLSAGGSYGRLCCEFNPDPTRRNATSTPWSWGEDSMREMQLWLDLAGDKSVASPSTWSVNTLSPAQLSKAAACFVGGSGLKGLVTTNSTTYSDGPPKFRAGALEYEVASPHYLRDGSTFLGTYDLLIKSQVARCLYGFSSAPVKAVIEILNSEGKNSIATTTFQEKAGWMRLSAAGFTFSAPVIKVTLQQEGSSSTKADTKPARDSLSNPAEKTITCIKGSAVKKVTSKNPKCPSGFKKRA